MATFNPGDSLFRVAHEPAPGVIPIPASAGWIDFKPLSSKVGNTNETIPDESISGNSQATEGLPGKFSTGGEISVNANAEGSALFLANAQRKVTTTTLTTGVFQHYLSPTADDPIAATMAYLTSRADDLPQVFRGMKVSELQFSFTKDGLLELTIQVLAARGDYYGSAVVVLDPSATPPPQIRGLPSHPNFVVTDGDIFVKITGVANIAATPPTLTCKAKIGSASTYGAVTFEAPVGNDADGNPKWAEILDSNGTNGAGFGVRGNNPEIHFRASTGAAVNDEWEFTRERPVWVPAFADVLAFSNVYAKVFVDGVGFCVEQVEITITLPVEAKTCLGGFFPDEIRDRGVREVQVSIDKEYVDTEHRKRLETAKTFGLRVEAYTGVPIGATAFEHSLTIVCPRIRPTGEQADVDSSTEMTETIEGQAFPDPENADDFFDDCTLILVNSLSDIATAVP